MASPPAKRQRRLKNVVSSDDSEHEVRPNPKTRKSRAATTQLPLTLDTTNAPSTAALPTRSKTKSDKPATTAKSRTSRATSVKKSPLSTPEKKKAGNNVENGSKSLHTFFQAATEEDRWKRQSPLKKNTTIDEIDEIEDFIDDDSLDEAMAEIADSHSQKPVLPGIPPRTSTQSRATNFPASQGPPAPRFLFQKPEKPSVKPTSRAVLPVEDMRPWADRFGPMDLDELAVHKKKQQDVERWLAGVLNGRDNRRLLVLKGPAGSGKTTTLSLLANTLNADLVEWRSPGISDFSQQGYASMSAQFEEFLNRGGNFGSLDFADEDEKLVYDSQSHGRKRILVVEEFPAILTRLSSALQNFRSTIVRFLAMNATSFPLSQTAGFPPVVMIISETSLASSSSSIDSFTAHRLLGPEISQHPGVSIIEFNPVAPTFISKALDLVIKKEARSSQRRRIPGPAVLKQLSEMGDVRSAISSLEFLCLKGDTSSDWSGRVAAKTKRSLKDASQALTSMEKDSLEMITQRESSLGMFHAVGKVVWNKREEPSVLNEPQPTPPPPHLQYLHRPKISQVVTDTLIDETGTDAQTFVAALHENYLLSCDGDDFVDTLDDCIAHLSDSDLLSAESSHRVVQGSRRFGGGGGFSSGVGASIDILRQDEISFHTATRGLIFSLPYPVKRRAHPSRTQNNTSGSNGGGGSLRTNDAHKMFYPTSLRLWRAREEITDELELWQTRLLQGGGSTDLLGQSHNNLISKTPTPSRSVNSWASRNALLHNNNNISQPTLSEPEPQFQTRLSTRDLLETHLPYLSQITTRTSMTPNPTTTKTTHQTRIGLQRRRQLETSLDKIVSFGGVGSRSEDAPDELSDRGGTRRGKGKEIKDEELIGNADVEAEVEKLVLSDDDIEDD